MQKGAMFKNIGRRAMQWFYDMKVGKRLMVSFGALLTLLVLVAGVGLWGLIASEHKVMTMLDTEGQLLQHANRLRANILGMRMNEKGVFFNVVKASDKATAAHKAWLEEDKGADDRLAELDKAAVDEADQAEIKRIRADLKSYREGFAKVWAMVGDGRITSGDQGLQALAPYLDTIHDLDAKVQDLAQRADKTMNEDRVSIGKTSQKVVWIVLAVAFSAICLGVLLATVVARSIRVPLMRSVDFSNAIAAGNMDVTLDIRAKDETGMLQASMARMAESIKGLLADTGQIVAAAVEGRLTFRAEAGRHQGEYRKIIEGVNETMDRIVGFLDNMPAQAMIIDNEFTVRYMNEMGAKIGGRSQKDVVGVKCYNHFKTSDCRSERCACSRAIRDGHESSRPYKFTRFLSVHRCL